ncbi:MAG TPA: hypothetical protein VN911_13455 [Candidatus Acidoferrum sp.]|nr:hypothetical protein [Candidatus Acidoferrum sp.]
MPNRSSGALLTPVIQNNPAGRIHSLFSRRWFAVPFFSVASLVPCFWQSRIQAGDLGSHIYNAWLATLIQQGRAPGLYIASPSNNILFDLLLQWLLPRVGMNLTQRIAVSASVLIFVWGAVLFVSRCARPEPHPNLWVVIPCIAMLAYGYIYHMGFFNLYLSMGLVLWYLAIFWEGNWVVRTFSTPILMLAWLAHPLPVAWALGTGAYAGVARKLRPELRLVLVITGSAVLIAARVAIAHSYAYSWSTTQVFFATGANQINLFGPKYHVLYICLLLVWFVLLMRIVFSSGLRHLLLSIPFQLWLLNAAAVVLIPNRILFPQFALPLGFIADRMSFCAALMMCAVVAVAPARRFEKAALALIAVLFFALLYNDTQKLNHIEDRIDLAVSNVPFGQRVISSITPWPLHMISVQHALDRACIGHCFSYANYEAASHQFRIRAEPGNGFMMDNYIDVRAVQSGEYSVQGRDLPVYILYECGHELIDVCSRALEAGEVVGPH